MPSGARVGVKALAWPCLAQLGFLGLMVPNDGGAAVGPRYFVQLMPLLSMLAVLALRSRTRAFAMIFAVLAFVGLVFSVPAALQYYDTSLWMRPPHFPFKKWLAG